MSGKRLLDAAAVLKASRGVANKYVASTRHRLDAYSRTSTLAKAVKNQTDRATLTVRAASALSQRFNSPPAYSTRAKESINPEEETLVPSQAGKESFVNSSGKRAGIQQDHFYDRSPDNATSEPLHDEQIRVKQEQARQSPLPDGSIPPNGAEFAEAQHDEDVFSKAPSTEPAKEPFSQPAEELEDSIQPLTSSRSSIPRPRAYPKTFSADQAKKLQRQAEKQIPSRAAKPPPVEGPISGAQTTLRTEARPGVVDEQGVLHSAPRETIQVLSSLPRVKLPKATEQTQESDPRVSDDQINQDVFYSSEPTREANTVPEVQTIPEPEGPSEDMYSELFHSPKVAKILRRQSPDGNPTKGLNLLGANNTPPKETKSQDDKDQATLNSRIIKGAASEDHVEGATTTEEQTRSSEEEARRFAEDLAQDVQKGSPTQEIPSEVDSTSNQTPFEMHESRVPSSRFGRLWQYGGLATSMAFGAVGESFRRVTGGDTSGGSLMLSAANMERLVAKLSRMRGAALKLGQMMSFQDSKMLPGPINEVLQRVQDSADYMPAAQRNEVLASNLGTEWREHFTSFDEKPIAAASIGQVHKAVLKSTGMPVAIKIQYPGVANSIDSDLNNLSILLNASRLLPKGLYLDKTIANARTELAWECDYIREAEAGKRFQELLHDEQDTFTVPTIVAEASGPQVLTMEMMTGTGVTKLRNLSQEQKDWIGTHIVRLCLREITEFKYMQTDPNWTNFLYNSQNKKLELLDFGASREYPDKFILPYIKVLQAASRSDRDEVRDLSIQLGYLTGHESQAMVNAHVSSVLTLAEPFRADSLEVYDFRDQTITDRVRGLIPVILRERLAPPPEETYSLHRKLSGAFLLCARLGSRVRCREMFENAMGKAGVT